MKHYTVKWTKEGGGLKGYRLNVGRCLLNGAQTITIFSDMKGVRRRFASDGIASDWLNVGADLSAALAAEKARREREAS